MRPVPGTRDMHYCNSAVMMVEVRTSKTMNKKPIKLLAIAIAGLAITASTSAAGFTHPGLLNSKTELDFVKAKIKAGSEPWTFLFNAMKKSQYGNLNWTPHPLTVVNARSNDASTENDDAAAAYTQALLWYFTDNEAYAKKSVEILNAWSSKLTNHVSTDLQEQLVAAWCGSVFPLAGEILRASYPKWTSGEIKRFSAMLNQAFLPLLVSGNPTYNGNWELCMINALMCIGVFIIIWIGKALPTRSLISQLPTEPWLGSLQPSRSSAHRAD